MPVREAPTNQQLRYALRSWVAHLPHRRVWAVGHRPAWLTDGIGHIPTAQAGTKWGNTTLAIRAACLHPEVSDPFLWCNDDFFVMQPLPGGMPVLHRGLAADVEDACRGRVSSAYLGGMRETRAALEGMGYPMPVSYELHAPLPVGKVGMLGALARVPAADGMHKRTAYGVLAEIGGEQMDDVKISHRGPRGYGPGDVFLSTTADSFTHGRVGEFIRAAFPLPSSYERDGRR
ncbi:hypothetical protein ACKI16_29390 [Streptomyces scabiei]|uniref:hypothetical protein n=1 Tax=Streptomyces scabiei TaxID=1930 RepID=UPI0038F6A22C